MSARRRLEQRSAPALRWLSQQPVFLLPVAAAVLLIAGLAAPPVIGAALLAVLGVGLCWLAYLSWPVLITAQRVLRVVTAGLVLAAAAGRLSP